jgi:two-component system NtrC family sensor kinase
MKWHPLLKKHILDSKLIPKNFNKEELNAFLKINQFYYDQDEIQSKLVIISEQNKQLINSLKEKAKKSIIESNQAIVCEMSGGMAHEINNPLMVLQNILDLIDSEKYDQTNLSQHIQEAHSTIERISSIVKALNTCSKKGSSNKKFISCNIKSIIENALEETQRELSKIEDLQLSIDVPEKFLIMGNPEEIKQGFINLILNSKDAVCNLKHKWISVKSFESNNKIVIQFTDSGAGIPNEIQEKIMNPFFTTKSVGKGTGLGLAICKGIIETHNGKIYLNQEVCNTCFEISLPKIS